MTLLPPENESKDLVLHAEEPVAEISTSQVEEDNTSGGLFQPIDPKRKLEIGHQAKDFVANIARMDLSAPDVQKQRNDIESLAGTQVAKTSASSSRILENRSSSVAGAKAQGDSATVRVAKDLTDLRGVVEDLTPNQANLTKAGKILGMFPGGNKLRKYFQRYESAQSQLDKITRALLSGQDELRKDNASLQVERQNLWDEMQELREYIELAKALDSEFEKQVEVFKAEGKTQAAQTMSNDFLFPVRQRRQDLLQQLAVSTQGYMAMALVQNNNKELIKGVERARTTTLTALRTAVIVAEALNNQRLVLDQIDAVNKTTNNMIESTSELLRTNTVRIHEQAVNSGVSIETLQKAFDNIFATIDAVENFKTQANENMAKTISGLEGQLERVRPQLERTKALETGKN